MQNSPLPLKHFKYPKHTKRASSRLSYKRNSKLNRKVAKSHKRKVAKSHKRNVVKSHTPDHNSNKSNKKLVHKKMSERLKYNRRK